MSKIRERISEDLKQAMKNKDANRLSTLRMLKTEIVKSETSGKAKELDEMGLIKLLTTMKKQRVEAIEQYEKGNRQELADIEKKELEVLEEYLPQQLGEAEIISMVQEAIAETGATEMKQMGQVMKIVSAKAQGRADGKILSGEVRKQLASKA